MIRIGEAPATIDTPLEHLTACHRRIEDRLATLERAADYLRETPEAALKAIGASILFLDSSGVLHTMDEEASLFPRLRPHLTGEEAAHLDRLEQQHRETESVFSELKEVVAALAASPRQAFQLEPRYRRLVARLNGLYRPHIEFEDNVLMRIAHRTLDQGEIEGLSREMRTRRQKTDRKTAKLNEETMQITSKPPAMDELTNKVLKLFIDMGSESLDLHTLFEAGGNDPAMRERVLDVVTRLVDSGHLDTRSGDYYVLTDQGRTAAG